MPNILSGLFSPEALTVGTQALGDYEGAKTHAIQNDLQGALQRAQLIRQKQQDDIARAIQEKNAKHQAILDRISLIKSGPNGQLVDFGDPNNPKNVGPTPIDPVTQATTIHQKNRAYDVANPLPNTQKKARPTETTQRAALVYPRAAEAAKVLDKYYRTGAPVKSTAGKIPIVGNYILSEDEQEMNQAAETVASAILRLESGAAITQAEVKSYAKQFLPQPGDGPGVRAQKRATLATQLARIKQVADQAGYEDTNGADDSGDPLAKYDLE